MKILYIESKLKNLKLNLSKEEIIKLPKELILVYTIQYKELADSIKKQLESSKIKIIKYQQILGCSKISNIKNKPQLPILLIGSGRFHVLNLFLQFKEIFILENNSIKKISNEEIEKLRLKRKAALAKFLNAEKIGILVSTKPGQENLELALKLKQDIEKENKEAFIFISSTIDISQFENFNIDSWVNTACPGLSLDNPNMINYEEISKISR